MAERVPGVRVYADLDKFLADSSDLHFVDVTTPGQTHASITLQLIARRLNVLCEKPLALCENDARAMVGAANDAGVLLACAHNYRFKKNVQCALDAIRRGLLGDVVSASVKFRSGSVLGEPAAWRRRESESRTLLFDWAIHFVDLVLMFLGSPQEVHVAYGDVDNVGLQRVLFHTSHGNGSRGVFDLMADASSTCTEIEVLGEQAGMSLQFSPQGFRMLPRRDTPIHRCWAEGARTLDFIRGALSQRLRPARCPEQAQSHAALFREFVAAVKGEGQCSTRIEDVLTTVSLLDAVANEVYRSPLTRMRSTEPTIACV